MTREEAIKILADLTDNLFLHTWEEQYKALHMAIEALSESQIIRCKDCRWAKRAYHQRKVKLQCRRIRTADWSRWFVAEDSYCWMAERRKP